MGLTSYACLRFSPRPRLKAMNKCILCYVGSLNPQDGVDYLLRSLRYLLHDLKRSDFHCVIMGTGRLIAGFTRSGWNAATQRLR